MLSLSFETYDRNVSKVTSEGYAISRLIRWRARVIQRHASNMRSTREGEQTEHGEDSGTIAAGQYPPVTPGRDHRFELHHRVDRLVHGICRHPRQQHGSDHSLLSQMALLPPQRN